MRIFSIIFVLALLWTNAVQAAEPVATESFVASFVQGCPASLAHLGESDKVCDCLLKELRSRKQTVMTEQDIADFYAQANQVCVAPIFRSRMYGRCYQEMAPYLPEKFGLSKPQFTPFCECMMEGAMNIFHKPGFPARRSEEECARMGEMTFDRCAAQASAVSGGN